MTVIIEQYAVDQVGIVEIHQTVQIGISANQARRKVSHWLLREVTMMLSALESTLLVGKQTLWRVPVSFTASDVGMVGIAGYVMVDAQNGDFDRSPDAVELLLNSTRTLSQPLPPFQVKETPAEYLAANIPATPTFNRPTKNPLDLIRG